MKRIILTALGAALLVFLVFSYALEFVAFDKSFYVQQYKKNNLYAHFSREEADKVTDKLLSYLRYEKMNVQIDTPFFNDKEKRHLVDVKDLLQKESFYCTVLTFIFVLVVIILYFSNDLRITSRITYGTLFFNAGVVGLSMMLTLGILSILNFSMVWTSFHRLVFSNNLWMLNPATDNLIVLFPEAFFNAVVTKLFILMGVVYLFIIACGSWLKAR